MKTVRICITVICILAVAFGFFFRGKLFGSGTTPPIRDGSGNVIPGSVATLEKIQLGGMDQWILIRGHDRSNPILLWLHGGPGSSEMPIAHHFHRGLEKDFTVVQWDQRGAGKSNPEGFDESTMTFDRFFQDAHDLTLYLKKRFNKEKIYLLGHSWGSHLGLRLAQAYPEDYHAYIGVSQVVNSSRAQEIGYEWLQGRILAAGNQKDLQQLRRLGPAPYSEHDKFVKFVGLVSSYGGSFDLPMIDLLWIALQAPEYTLSDYLAWFRGSNRGSGPMWDSTECKFFDAPRDVPRLEVPVYFLSGENDYNTPLKLVEEYYRVLEAPRGKKLIAFANAAHTPFFLKPEEFNEVLRQIKAETYLSKSN